MAHGSLNGMASWDYLALGLLLSALLYSTIGQTVPRHEQQPEFLAPLENHTVTQGRDVCFTCLVNHLRSYKVAWIKSDSREILAMHTHMVAPNPRLSVTHNGHNAWKLHVLNVKPSDSGTYMCQVNTDPMRSLLGYMKVVIPPDIRDLDEAQNQLSSLERGEVRLRCQATGTPQPEVTWRREDGSSIILRTENSRLIAVKSHKGEQLHLRGILRQEMGSYLCIASNGVPPSVSKRYYVKVLFKPSIRTKEQVVFAHVNGDVTLKCLVEASPKSLTSWYAETGLKIGSSERHSVTESAINDYTHQVNLTIRRVRASDWTAYTCLTENSFGTASASIRLREQHKPSRATAGTGQAGLGVSHHNSLDESRKSINSPHSEDEFEDAPEQVDGKYPPALPGAHYGSTDFPGSGSPDRAAPESPKTAGVAVLLPLLAARFY
ncbi:lachesin isoform X1 [Nasonia vitripennis]|uniref:Ig-like domain-containing protein n=1 Tax=Nasonia vitripennis TaxID=7425 RepID=A0A7M7G429_NASVI|nr:lachesin isoform X1 [Nasonia vitripennis]XP_031782582.1 lachesin isoform X1 [Nasonia vitripennis]